MIDEILTGKTESHLTVDSLSNSLVHKDMLSSLHSLRDNARLAGFSLEIASAFRGFEAQKNIWNSKALGLRPLYDDEGIILDYNSLSPEEIVYAILRWSALPGASRHHWGTDFDVYDSSRIPVEYKVQLLPQEFATEGVFGEFNLWLENNLQRFGFYRPYEIDNGGIAPEKWHLSYGAVSKLYQSALSYELVESTIKTADIELKEVILRELPKIYPRFIDV